MYELRHIQGYVHVPRGIVACGEAGISRRRLVKHRPLCLVYIKSILGGFFGNRCAYVLQVGIVSKSPVAVAGNGLAEMGQVADVGVCVGRVEERFHLVVCALLRALLDERVPLAGLRYEYFLLKAITFQGGIYMAHQPGNALICPWRPFLAVGPVVLRLVDG